MTEQPLQRLRQHPVGGDREAQVVADRQVLEDRLAQRAGTLSGGEQKMLILGRALMLRPRLLLIDEISEGVQPSMVERLRGVLQAERASGVSMLVVEQHVAFALALADRYAVLKLGEIVDSGPAKAPDAQARVIGHLAV